MQKSPSEHHCTTRRTISLQLRHIVTIGKKLVKQQYLLHMSSQYGELRPTNGWDGLTSLGHPCKFQPVSRLRSVTARHLVVGVSQTVALNRGRHLYSPGVHHVGHWPTFLVVDVFVFFLYFSIVLPYLVLRPLSWINSTTTIYGRPM